MCSFGDRRTTCYICGDEEATVDPRDLEGYSNKRSFFNFIFILELHISCPASQPCRCSIQEHKKVRTFSGSEKGTPLHRQLERQCVIRHSEMDPFLPALSSTLENMSCSPSRGSNFFPFSHLPLPSDKQYHKRILLPT